jgi:DNA-binding transcriptional ArsR family regulator
MVTAPRVLDLAGRSRTTLVEVIATPFTELVVGLQTFQFEEAAHTFDVGPEWFDELRTTLSTELLAAMERLGPVGWGALLAKALVERWPTDLDAILDRIEGTPPEELWLLFAGRYVPPFADHLDPDVFRRALEGEPAAREGLLAEARAMFGEKEDAGAIWTLDAADTHRLAVSILRGWRAEVLATREQELADVLARDAEAKQRLRRSFSDEKLIEVATNGLLYVAESWVRRVILTPHLAMRPWNITSAHEDAYVICYPAADESLGIDRSAPPAHLLRLHKALADEKRLRILKLLAASDLTLSELSEAVGMAKSTAHHHTVILRAAGLIRTSTEVENRYSLRRESLAEAGTALTDYLAVGP